MLSKSNLSRGWIVGAVAAVSVLGTSITACAAPGAQPTSDTADTSDTSDTADTSGATSATNSTGDTNATVAAGATGETDAAGDTNATGATSSLSGNSREFDGIRLDSERLYNLYFGNPTEWTEADLRFSVDMDMYSYGRAQQCMQKSGYDYTMPTREQLERNSPVAVQLRMNQAVTRQASDGQASDGQAADDQDGGAAGGAAASADSDSSDPSEDLSEECLDVSIALREQVETLLSPYQQLYFDAIGSAEADPRVVQARAATTDCMSEAGYRLEPGEMVDAPADPALFDQQLAVCAAPQQATVDAVYREKLDEFAEQHRVEVMDAING